MMNRILQSLLFAACAVTALSAMEPQKETGAQRPSFVFDVENTTLTSLDDAKVKAHREALAHDEVKRGRWQVATAGAVIAGGGFLLARWWIRDNERKADIKNQRDLLIEQLNRDKQLAQIGKEALEEIQKKKRAADAVATTESGSEEATTWSGSDDDSDEPAVGKDDKKNTPAEPKKEPEVKKEDLKKIEVAVKDGKVDPDQLEAFMRKLVDTNTVVKPHEESWKEWGWRQATDGWNWLAFIPIILIKSRIAHEMSRYVYGFFPYPGRAASYLFTPRSVDWCMHEYTQFETAAKGLKTLAVIIDSLLDGSTAANPDLVKVKVWHSSTIFVREMEKVLGYMQYIIMQVKREEKDMRTTGLGSMNFIRSTMHDYVFAINRFLKGDISVQNLRMLVNLIEGSLLEVVTQLEAFDYVARHAGFEDLENGARFDYWKTYLKPSMPKSPKEQEAEAKAAEFADLKKIFEAAVDFKGILDAGM